MHADILVHDQRADTSFEAHQSCGVVKLFGICRQLTDLTKLILDSRGFVRIAAMQVNVALVYGIPVKLIRVLQKSKDSEGLIKSSVAKSV